MKATKIQITTLLNEHYDAFYSVVGLARKTKHPVPMDTRGWSQILVSVLTGIDGVGRQKGADLCDGSDVKGANTWEAIDTPRFNGVVKAGTLAEKSDSMQSLDEQPYLFLVLWDHNLKGQARCRIWVVRTPHDGVFRGMCADWYAKRVSGEIRSTNFQLHPPRGKDGNIIRNTCGNLEYPLLFSATRLADGKYKIDVLDHKTMTNGACSKH